MKPTLTIYTTESDQPFTIQGEDAIRVDALAEEAIKGAPWLKFTYGNARYKIAVYQITAIIFTEGEE